MMVSALGVSHIYLAQLVKESCCYLMLHTEALHAVSQPRSTMSLEGLMCDELGRDPSQAEM